MARLLSDGGHDPLMTAGRGIHARDDAMIGQLTGTSQRCRLEGWVASIAPPGGPARPSASIRAGNSNCEFSSFSRRSTAERPTIKLQA